MISFLKKLNIIFILAFISLNAFSQEKYTVKKGDTLYSICKVHGVNLEEVCKINSFSKDVVLKIDQVILIPEKNKLNQTKSGPKTYGKYIVKEGDTLSKIAKAYGISVEELCSINSLTKSSVLKIKQELKVPKLNTVRQYDSYTVQKGDTFYRIAKINGISVDELKDLNNITDESILKIGSVLKIPKSNPDTKNYVLPDLPSNDPRKYSNKKVDSSLVWPVKNPKVTYMNGKVGGVQLSSQKNEKVTCIRAGTVMYVGNYRGYGQVVFVQSKTGHIYTYSGLGSIKVRKGDYLVFGDVIGTAGTDSIKGTSQICLMVFQKSKPIDPAKAPRG